MGQQLSRQDHAAGRQEGRPAGRSGDRQLADPSAQRPEPALTTYGRNNHSVRSERWRYIRYRDGSEELYDHGSDKMEWTHLAAQSKYDDVKKDLARWLPKVNAPDSPAGGKNKP